MKPYNRGYFIRPKSNVSKYSVLIEFLLVGNDPHAPHCAEQIQSVRPGRHKTPPRP